MSSELHQVFTISKIQFRKKKKKKKLLEHLRYPKQLFNLQDKSAEYILTVAIYNILENGWISLQKVT